jgi:hypothetical protein
MFLSAARQALNVLVPQQGAFLRVRFSPQLPSARITGHDASIVVTGLITVSRIDQRLPLFYYPALIKEVAIHVDLEYGSPSVAPGQLHARTTPTRREEQRW